MKSLFRGAAWRLALMICAAAVGWLAHYRGVSQAAPLGQPVAPDTLALQLPDLASTLGRLGAREATRSISFAPQQPQIMYAVLRSGALNKTSDGGATWAEIALPAALGYARAVVVNPAAPATVFLSFALEVTAETANRLARSTDGGNSWTEVLLTEPDVNIAQVEPLKSNARIVYVTLNRRLLSGIYRRWPTGLPGSGIVGQHRARQ